MKSQRLLILLVPMVLLFVLGVACGDDAPAPSGLTAADVKSAVAEAVGDTVSGADISKMVTDAVSGIDIPEGVSASDVSKLVNEAVAGIDIPEGVSASEIDKMVRDATAAAACRSAVLLRLRSSSRTLRLRSSSAFWRRRSSSAFRRRRSSSAFRHFSTFRRTRRSNHSSLIF